MSLRLRRLRVYGCRDCGYGKCLWKCLDVSVERGGEVQRVQKRGVKQEDSIYTRLRGRAMGDGEILRFPMPASAQSTKPGSRIAPMADRQCSAKV